MFRNGLEFSVLVNGKVVREYSHNGRMYIEGRDSSDYKLKLVNNTNRDVEVIFSVDGLDTIDGEDAATTKTGYVVRKYSSMLLDGWRLNDHESAKFRFGSTGSSYAALSGKPRNIGVIGAAVFLAKQHQYYPFGYHSNLTNVSGTYSPVSGTYSTDYSSKGLRGTTCSNSMPVSATMDSMEVKTSGGLGTQFGEKQASHVQHVNFERESNVPNTVFEFHYNDRKGLEELGIPVAQPLSPDNARRETAKPFGDLDNGCKPPPGWQG